MKQVNKQIQRVCKLPSVPSSINCKINGCHAGRWFTGFPLKKSCEKVTKWEVFLLEQGKKVVHRTDQPSAQKDSLGCLLSMQDKMYKNVFVRWDCCKTWWISLSVSL